MGWPAPGAQARSAKAWRRSPIGQAENSISQWDWDSVTAAYAAFWERHQRTPSQVRAFSQRGTEAFDPASSARLVLDNLSTHTPAALYQSLPAAEAPRVLRRLEFHYAAKHAS